MNARVNLTIDGALLAKVKRYASTRHSSVSQLVEAYLKTCVDVPVHKSLIDIVEELPPSKLDLKGDLSKQYFEESIHKYGV